MPEMKACKYCGKEVGAGSNFCWYCHRELEARPERPEPEHKSSPVPWIVVGVIAVIVVVLLLLAPLF
jgi:hypothetical protein